MTDIPCYPEYSYNTGSGIPIRNTGTFPNLKQYPESRYTPLATGEDDGFDFKECPKGLNEEFESRIAKNVVQLLR